MARARVQVLQARAAQVAADRFEESLGWPRTLGEAMQRYRSQHRLTLRALADTLGVSPQYLSDVERGERNFKVDRAAAWADKLGVPASVLVRYVLQRQVEGLAMRVRIEAA